MLKEHDLHVPSVDTSEDTSDTNNWIDFLDRVDANDRSLFTEGTGITLAKHPTEKPGGIAGQLFDAREGTRVAPVIDSLWTFQGAAPLEAVANRSGLSPQEVSEVVGKGIQGILQITTASMLEEQVSHNPNTEAIIQGVEKGTISPNQPVVFSRPLADFYERNDDVVAD